MFKFNPLGRVNGSQVAVPGMRAFREAQNHGVQNRPRPRLTHWIPSRYLEKARVVHVNCILRIHEVCTLSAYLPQSAKPLGAPCQGRPKRLGHVHRGGSRVCPCVRHEAARVAADSDSLTKTARLAPWKASSIVMVHLASCSSRVQSRG
jgi:hypothetical protein